jgi:GR25 family glycosyltransferase involved in LPS biosynthesis
MLLKQYILSKNIKQIYLSPSLAEHKYTVLKNLNVNYNNKNAPTLFYGLYRNIDIETIEKHEGSIYILWYDNDCNPNYKTRVINVKRVTKINIIQHLCYYDKTSNYLNELNIDHIIIEFADNSKDTIQEKNINITVNSIFDKVFVINMKKDIMKRKLMQCKLDLLNIDYEFYNAIDGSDHPYIDDYNEYRKKPVTWGGAHYYERTHKKKIIRNPWGWGYLMSWKNILEKIIDKQYKRVLVFDDDVIFDKNFKEKFSTFITSINDDWHIITLGVSQHVWGAVKVNKNYYSTPFHTDGSFALGIDRSIFQDLLNSVTKMNCVFDSGAVRDIYKHNKLCYTCYPNIVIADVSNSTIGGNRNIIKFAKKVKWDLNNFNYIKYLNITVSIIIPMYNASKTIKLCLDSLLCQTYNFLEIIVIDDCSTDSSYGVVKEYVLQHNNIFIYKTEQNSGCYVARNLGINKATGSYIAIQDSDDISLKDRIEIQMKEILEREILVVGCNFLRTKEEISMVDINNNIQNQIKKYKECRPRFGLVTLLFNKEVFNKYGLFRDDYRHSMDEEFMERLYYKLYGKLCNKHIHTLLCTNNNENSEFYYKINKLLYVSTPMNDDNITSKYNKTIRQKIRKIVLDDINKN